jgi:hypothetical protein
MKKSHPFHNIEKYSYTYTCDNQCKTVQNKKEPQRSVRKLKKSFISKGSLNNLVEEQA